MIAATKEQRAEWRKKAAETRLANVLKHNRDMEQIGSDRREALIYRDGLKEQITFLESTLSGMRQIEAITIAAARLDHSRLLMPHEIVSASLNYYGHTGVYFLIFKEELVYVGQSVNVFARISSHADKHFDKYAFIPCSREDLDTIESLYIHVLRPRLNGVQQNGEMSAPLTYSKLLNLLG